MHVLSCLYKVRCSRLAGRIFAAMDQGVHYSTFGSNSASANKSSNSQQSQNESIILCKGSEARGWCVYLGILIINILLSLTFAIAFIILTAVGKKNISTYDRDHDIDKMCDCTLFTPSLGYGFGGSLFIELGLIAGVFVLAAVAVLCCSKSYKLVLYYALVDATLIVLNFIAFLCMTLAVIVFVARGGQCCSVTSIVVASLSSVLLVLKIVFVVIVCCYSYCCDSEDDS